MKPKPTVYIVDDDESVRRSLRWLIESAQLSVETFASGEAFLDHYDPLRPACLILDIRMHGMNGLEVQRKLIDNGFKLPVIVMTGHGDVTTCTKAFKSGAVDFIEKPADEKVLLKLILDALAADAQRLLQDHSDAASLVRLSDLTPRESEVMDLIIKGSSQKQIAAQLDISIQTTAKHRAKVLEKLGVSNDVELARLVLGSKASKPG